MTDKIRKIMGVSLLALAFSLVCGEKAQAQTCLTQPSCAAMGYKQKLSDCGNRAVLRCPFALTDDNQVFCTAYTDANGREFPQVGDILFSDMSWGSTPRSDKRAIGVVFDTFDLLAIGLEETTAPWGGCGKDIPSLANCDNKLLTCGIHGKSNTAAILAYGKANNVSYPAAEYCNTYETTGTKAGDWFLPSYAQLKQLYSVKDKVNATLKALGKIQLHNDFYWSSTEAEEPANMGYLSWLLDMNNATPLINSKEAIHNVRPVIAF